jgi:hypothetical protein
MPALAPPGERITALVCAIGLIAGCKSRDADSPATGEAPAAPPREDAQVAQAVAQVPGDAVAVPADAAASPDDDGDDGANKLTIRIVEPRPAGSGLARRCTLGGDPLATACVGGGAGLAFDARGTLYIAADHHVRRYRRTPGDACAYEPAGEPVALPAEVSRPQRIDKGPVYMRSGGPSWAVVVAGDAVYAFDFLGGLYRIDRGTAEPACTAEFGYDSVAWDGKRLLAARRGIEQLVPGKRGACTARDTGLAAKGRTAIYAVRGRLYLGAASKLTRVTAGDPEPLGAGTRICSITGVVACGDGACIADNNCMQLVQLDGDDAVVRTIDSMRLFDARPYGLGAAAAAPGGAVFLLARHRDQVGKSDVCEAALYEVPAAAFAL